MSYSSSQLNKDRAKVVSICRTVSVLEDGQYHLRPITMPLKHTSNSSLVVKPRADWKALSGLLKRNGRGKTYKFPPAIVC